MKISAQTGNESVRLADKRVEEQKRSERFAQLLKDKNKREPKNEKSSKQSGEAQTDRASATGPDPTGRESLPQFGASAKSPEAADAKTTPQSFAADELADELGHQIDLLRAEGRVQGVNLTFTSKTLEGLHVQIRQQEGDISIRFVTNQESLSKLLGQNAGDLRDALSQRGVKVRNIAISSRSQRSFEDSAI